MDFNLFYTLAGFVVGFIIGMTGVGGGSLMTPILVLGFGIQPAIAVGTDLLYAAITKSGGIWFHHRNGNIDWQVVKRMALGSIPACLVALGLLNYLHAAGVNYDRIITNSLSIALILTASVILFRRTIQRISERENMAGIRALHKKIQIPATVFFGALIGALVTLSSVGAGAIGAAILLFLYPRLRTVQIVGTDLAHAIPITLIAGLGHLTIGTVDLMLLAGLVIGSLPGIYLGSQLANWLPDKVIRPLLASMLLLIGIKMAIS